MIRSADCYLLTEVSGQSIGPIFKDEAVLAQKLKKKLLDPLKWDRQYVPERRSLTTNLRYVTSQKI
jgi:hypothetical protein